METIKSLITLVVIIFSTVCLIWMFGKLLMGLARGAKLSADEQKEVKQAMVGKYHPPAGNWGKHLEALDQPQPREWRE